MIFSLIRPKTTKKNINLIKVRIIIKRTVYLAMLKKYTMLIDYFIILIKIIL